MSPYLGHREPNLSELGVSPTATETVVALRDADLAARITALVGSVARNDDDRSLLLEALGIAPTTRAAAV